MHIKLGVPNTGVLKSFWREPLKRANIKGDDEFSPGPKSEKVKWWVGLGVAVAEFMKGDGPIAFIVPLMRVPHISIYVKENVQKHLPMQHRACSQPIGMRSRYRQKSLMTPVARLTQRVCALHEQNWNCCACTKLCGERSGPSLLVSGDIKVPFAARLERTRNKGTPTSWASCCSSLRPMAVTRGQVPSNWRSCGAKLKALRACPVTG